MAPQDIDQIAYSYRTSQRPGIRVREIVAEDGESGGYWRLATLYDDQLGVGMVGDTTNDYKYQYVGAVYRDLDRGVSQYAIQGSFWIFTPPEDLLGARVMPPFAGPGNGGWTTEGGPIMRLKGQDIHTFILPTGVGPGAVLQVGDPFRFAGHIAPTLDSQVAYTVTAPSGVQHTGGGRANKIGYFHDPADDFAVDQPGAWTVDVHVWHDGRCSGGQTIKPYPQGDVLGGERGRYRFYVVPQDATALHIQSPAPGYLHFGDAVKPIAISGRIPAELHDAVVDYTITMPGFILEHGQAQIVDNVYTVLFDPARLNQDYPNLDLIGRDRWRPGLADNFSIGLLLTGTSAGRIVQRANVLSIIDEEVAYRKVAAPDLPPTVTPTPTPSATRAPTATGTPTQTRTPQRFPAYLPLLLEESGGAP